MAESDEKLRATLQNGKYVGSAAVLSVLQRLSAAGLSKTTIHMWHQELFVQVDTAAPYAPKQYACMY